MSCHALLPPPQLLPLLPSLPRLLPMNYNLQKKTSNYLSDHFCHNAP
jgi:hypothetical protein